MIKKVLIIGIIIEIIVGIILFNLVDTEICKCSDNDYSVGILN